MEEGKEKGCSLLEGQEMRGRVYSEREGGR